MSNPSVPPHSQVMPSRNSGFRQRMPLYAAGIGLAVLVLAYFDGGEKPIRPIVKAVELPSEIAPDNQPDNQNAGAESE